MKKNLLIVLFLIIGTSSALGAAAVSHPNYDASMEEPTGIQSITNGSLPRQAWVQSRRSSRNNADGYPSNEDERLGTTTFLWARPNVNASPLTAARQQERAALVERTTREFLGHNGVRLGLNKHTIANARLYELHDTKHGPFIARYQQIHGNVEVFGRSLNVMLDRDLQPIAVSGYFAPDDSDDSTVSATANAKVRQSPQQAIAIAVADLGGQIDPGALESLGERDNYTSFRIAQQTGEYRLIDTPRSKRVFFPLDGRLVPAWYLEVTLKKYNRAEKFSYGYVVAAGDGRILFRNNHVTHTAFSYRVFADATDPAFPFDSPLGNDLVPLPVLDQNLSPPRIFTASNLVTLESGPIASGDPWLPDGATETVGNNVDAYVDLGGGNGLQPRFGDFRARVTSPYHFDYPVTANTDPTTQTARNGGIVNLFYTNNYLHDWWYGNGFDEAAGNAQTNNYGRGGIGGDPILAEAQDYSDRNNADMDTPADGRSPRMQMYLWDGLTSPSVSLFAEGLGSLVVNTADFGAMQFNLAGWVSTVTPGDACTTLMNTGDLNGKIALINRGNCDFVDKAENAQRAGAIGAIIINNINDGTASGMTGSNPTVTIPVLSTSFGDGIRIREKLTSGPLTVAMYRVPNVDYDGSIDNSIIAHEWFHHVSSRLVGNSNGLSNNQGASLSEGWSDVNVLLLEARPEDVTVAGNVGFQGAYPFGIYVMSNAYFGIRRAPYATNPAVFPMTFKHITDGVELPTTAPLTPGGGNNSEAHNAGEIWANTLWDFYVSLLNDPRHTFHEAQERMKDYIITGLKMTPNSPTFLEARDALLAAAKATDRADFELAAKSFAKYGMGIGAVAPARDSYDNAGVVESFVALIGAYEVVETTLDTSYLAGTVGYCDTDRVLDVGETALLTLRIQDAGNFPLPRKLIARVSSDADVLLGNSGRIVFGAFNTEGFATGSLPVTLRSSATAATLRLKITFPQVGATANSVIEPQPEWIERVVNYDLRKSFTVDDVERIVASMADWSLALSGGTSNMGEGWRITADLDNLYHTGQAWFIPDNDTPTDTTLTSPLIKVGRQPFSVNFDTAFRFEIDPYDGPNVSFDGGVVEIKIDDGRWQDVLAAGGKFSRGGYNSQIVAFAPYQDIRNARHGFGGYSAGLTPQTIDFGTSLVGHKVRLRFRAISDDLVGELGWLVDNIRVVGASNRPFSNVLADSAACLNPL